MTERIVKPKEHEAEASTEARLARLPTEPSARGAKSRGRPYLIDPLAFFLALVGAPLAVAVGGFWLILIPVFAVIMGSPLYLVLGTPILLWLVGRYGPHAGICALAGLVTMVALLGLFHVADTTGLLTLRNPGSYYVLGYFGLFFAPIWGAVFAWLYRALERRFFATLNLAQVA